MLDFFRRFTRRGSSSPAAPDPAATLNRLYRLTTDATIEDVWDAMDQCADAILEEVRTDVEDGKLGEFPLHAATLWLAYHESNRGVRLPDWLVGRLFDSIVWAFRFEENHVLLGGALGTLDGVEAPAREEVALRVFRELGEESARRYWLLLKVRTDVFVAEAFDALDRYTSPGFPGELLPAEPTEDPEMEDARLPAPNPRTRMAGAFRQFGPEDVDVLLRHYRLEHPGADILVEALAATRSPRVVSLLKLASRDERPHVSTAATRALRALDSHR